MANNKLTQDGFLHIPQVFTELQVNKLRQQVDHCLELYSGTQDILYEENVPKKLLYSFNKSDMFLEILASDALLKLLVEISDDAKAIVPTWEDVVIKQPHSKNGFKPHQDLPLQSLIGNTFSIAIYLHDSLHNPVYFLPGSHKLGPLTRIQINDLYQQKSNAFKAVSAKAGDVVIHYAKTVHYSPDNSSSKPRYTWYIEFRTLNQLFLDSPWDRDWVLQRRAILVYALKKFNPEKLAVLAPDYQQLKPYLDQIQLKVPHVTSDVDYDMESPYYHF